MTCTDSPGTVAWNALVQLAADVRPKGAPTWHEPGIKSAIRDALANERRFTFAELALVVIRAAANAENLTPASIGFDASWSAASNPSIGKRYGWDEGDPRYVCGICDLAEPVCRSRAATNGHDFTPRTKCLPATIKTGWTSPTAKCLGGHKDYPCSLPVGHDGHHHPAPKLPVPPPTREPQPPPPPDPAVVETEQQVTEEAAHG